jgi:hypothetical protein
VSATQSDQIAAKAAPRARRSPAAFAWRPGPGAVAWAGPFCLVLGILLVRNAWMFSVPAYEDADMGAYSIQVEQARRFALLVGNYSREKFNHPGPRVPVRPGVGRGPVLRPAAGGARRVERGSRRALPAQLVFRGVRGSSFTGTPASCCSCRCCGSAPARPAWYRTCGGLPGPGRSGSCGCPSRRSAPCWRCR